MLKKNTRILSAILALVMVISLLPMSVWAEDASAAENGDTVSADAAGDDTTLPEDNVLPGETDDDVSEEPDNDFPDDGTDDAAVPKELASEEETDLDELSPDETGTVVASGYCGDPNVNEGKNVTWSLDSEGVLTISGSGAMESFTSSYVNHEYVYSMPWAQYSSDIKEVEIGSGVTSVGDYAFSSCSSLRAVSLPSGLVSIGEYAFYGCSKLTGIILPDSLTGIGTAAFDVCSRLTEIAIPKGVTELNYCVFQGCSSLEKVTLPDGLISIGFDAFFCCEALKEIRIPKTVVSIGIEAFSQCRALTSVVFSEGITSVGMGAFCSSNLSDLSIPASLSSIGSDAFNYTNIDTINVAAGNLAYYSRGNCLIESATGILLLGSNSSVIPSGITGIASKAFSGCDKLTSVVIPEGITDIKGSTFYGCHNLESVTLPDGLLSIGSSAFGDCLALSELSIPDTVTSIGGYAFMYCSRLTRLAVPGSVLSIGDEAFKGCLELASVTLSEGLEEIGEQAFYHTSLREITIPSTVTDIGAGAFVSTWQEGSSVLPTLRHIHFAGNAPEYVGGSLARSWDNFYITYEPRAEGFSTPEWRGYPCFPSDKVPDTYTETGWSGSCGSENNPGGIGSVTWRLDEDGVLTVSGTGDIADYSFQWSWNSGCEQTTAPWRDCIESIRSVVIQSGVTGVGKYAFYGCRFITSVTLPASAVSIGDYAFYRCTALSVVTLPQGVETVGDYAFYRCTALSVVTLPQGVETVGSYAFSDCTALAELSVAGSVRRIGDFAFSGCSSLRAVTIPEGVETVESLAFHGCTALASVTLPRSLVRLGVGVFSGCGLSSATVAPGNELFYAKDGCILTKATKKLVAGAADGTMPAETESIGDYTYCGASWLTSVTIPNGVKSIGSFAFSDCSSLASLKIPQSVAFIGSYAFLQCEALVSVTVPQGVTAINDYTFCACTGLRSIFLPAGITRIGVNAFLSCSSLQDVFFAGTKTQWNAVSANESDNRPLFLASLHTEYSSDEAIDSGYCGSPDNAGGEESLLWSLAQDGTLTIIGKGAMTDYSLSVSSSGSTAPWCNYDVEIRQLVIGSGVTHVGNYAFYGCINAERATLPVGLKSIGASAFQDCSHLTAVSLPTGLESIGYYAFGRCSALKEITLPSGLKTIASYAFKGCSSLTSVAIPAGISVLNERTFEECTGLKSVSISAGVSSIDVYAFDMCTALESITVDSGNKVYHAAESCLIKTADKKLVLGCKSSVIPDDGSVTSIGDLAFSNCRDLTSIVIPQDVTSIGYRAFYFCSRLTAATLPVGLITIGSSAFELCSELEGIAFPASLTSIGSDAFLQCSALTCITVADGNNVFHADGNCLIKTGAKELVMGCKSSVIPDDGTVTSIGSNAFLNCAGLSGISIPDGVTTIGSKAFCGCTGLTSVSLPATVTSVYKDSFLNCSSLSSIKVSTGNTVYHADGNCLIKTGAKELVMGCKSSVIPDDGTVTSIGDSAFNGCTGLTWIIIPEGVTTVGMAVFYGCTGLTGLVIPRSVKTIGGYFLYGCTSPEVNYTGSQEEWSAVSIFPVGNGVINTSSIRFDYVPVVASGSCGAPANAGGAESVQWALDSAGLLTVSGAGAMQSYFVFSAFDTPDSSAPWAKNTLAVRQVKILPGVTSVGSSAFFQCSDLEEVTLPDSIETVGAYAFEECIRLREITLRDGITDVGCSAFCGCSSLSAVTIPGTVQSLGTASFTDCKSLTALAIPDSVISIGENAFSRCRQLRSVTLGSGLTTLGRGVFCDCSSLSSIILPDGVVTVGEDTFGRCTSLTSLVVPDGVKVLPTGFLFGCTALKEVFLPVTVESVGAYAFGNCTGLTDVYYAGSKIQWDAITVNSDRNGALTSAEKHYEYGYVPPEATLSFASAQVRAGDNVTVSFVLEDTEPLKTILFSGITYDDTALELVSGKWEVEGVIHNFSKATSNAVITFGQNTDVNGAVFTLTFKVLEGTEDGDYEVGCSILARTKPAGGEETPVAVTVVPGVVTVKNYIPGDVNGDNDVDSDDAIYLLFYTLMPEYYPISQPVDYDGSGEVDSDDAIYLLFYTLMPEYYPLMN